LKELLNKKVVVISALNSEDTELVYPYYRLREAGADVIIK